MIQCHQKALNALTFVFILFGTPLLAGAQDFTNGQINVISARLAESALKSWELGTRSQAILELNASAYSVFSSTPLPPPSTIPSNLTSPLTPFFAIAKAVVSNRTATNNTVGPQALIPADGSAADPASIGMCVLLANWTNQDAGQIDYAGAARDQLNFLLQDVPRTSDGAISHRISQVQLWSDFVYMVPPFLAYYGVLSRNRTLLGESYNQIKLYRNYLRDPTQSMWRHVLLGTSGNDEGFWSTGNGWAAAGMLRVLATIRQSEYANTFKTEQNDLSNWVREIHSGIYPHLSSENLFTNYADQPSTAPGNFYDAASTALLTSTVYRAAVMLKQFHYIPFAEKSRKTLLSTSSVPTSNSSSSFDGYNHLTSDGWLTPVVNPDSYGMEGQQSPESEAFVVEMHSAWRDWVRDGSKGTNTARSIRLGTSVVGAWIGMGVVSMLVMAGAVAI
ncbi:Six-hairpin glycosidase [Phlegmacium glaucopus]|nr:Six-hairpin glycosidase [Phlegmacium glaucopus]